MPEIPHLIKMLQDENHNNRYQACEELRVSKSPLPQEAIDALIIATSDTDPDVADAARRALTLHTSNTYNTHTPNAKNTSTSPTPTLKAGIVGAIIVMIVLLLPSMPSDNLSPESYEAQGNLMMAAVVFTLFILIPLVLLITIIETVHVIKKVTNKRDRTIVILQAFLPIILMIGAVILFFNQ